MTEDQAVRIPVRRPEEVTAGDLIQRLTDLKRACPLCGHPLVGGRVWLGETYLGLICHDCDAVFRFCGVEES